jgi:hypothetical protein
MIQNNMVTDKIIILGSSSKTNLRVSEVKNSMISSHENIS